MLSEVLGRCVKARLILIYDASRNLIWEYEGSDGVHVQRKGACPAPSTDVGSIGPFRFTGHP